jgi:hypothetical protein
MEARGVVSMNLTIGSKSLATASFIIKVQGNYSIILGCEWIHANRYIYSTLHQFIIQWTDWLQGSTQCQSGKNLIGYDFLSISNEGFVPVSIKPASEAWLGNVVFQ